MTLDPYQLVTFRGRTVDRITQAALEVAEQRLGYELTITQGSYNAGRVSASAGTHDGGGVVDLAPYDGARKLRVLKDLGFAAWFRPAIRGLWSPHIHAVLIGNARLAPAAARQVDAYKAGRDGLAGNSADPSYRPDPIPQFHMPEEAEMPLSDDDLTKIRSAVRAEVAAELNQQLDELGAVKIGDPSGTHAPWSLGRLLWSTYRLRREEQP